MTYDDKDTLCKAMRKAEEAFENAISEEGLDAAYFDLRLEGYTLNHNFTKPLNKVVFEETFKTQETEDEEENEPGL